MSLRQFRLVPSGCQTWNGRVMASGGDWFVYCSTLAIYVYNLRTFALEKLLTAHQRTITCVTWSPHADETFATCANDGQLIPWSAATGKPGTRVRIPGGAFPVQIDWSVTREHQVAVATNEGSIAMWNVKGATVTELFSRLHHKDRQKTTVMRWNQHRDGLLASGHSDGSLCLYITAGSPSSSRMSPKDRTAVVDLQWDPLSPYYMLVAYKAGDISLWDMENEAEMHSFNRQGGGLRSLAWMDWAPGNFASVNNRTGVIRVWNVSQKHPLQLIRASRSGFNSLTFVPGSEQALCAFIDGSISVFHITKQQPQFKGLPGHTETIFDVRYQPSDKDVLATSSYDSSVKLWHTPTMECKQTLTGQSGVIYAISWAPGDDTRLASGSSNGELYVWDTVSGRPLSKIKNHKKSVFRVDWNKSDVSLIATSSGDHTCVVQDDAGVVSRRFQHPQAVYGCSWCPFNKNLLVTGCHDGCVRVFDISGRSDRPVRVLSGHRLRVFNTVWSPLLRNVLASGSDDCIIRVWDITSGESQQLVGHEQNVRALVWHCELPFVLLSGSWDGTIRTWDTRTQTCLKVVSDHHADVYGLDAHPSRPFVFASSSRDTSLRFWMLDGVASKLKTRSVLGEPWADVLGTLPAGGGFAPSSLPTRLYGEASRDLSKQLSALPKEASLERLQKVFEFFGDADGMREFWGLLKTVRDGTPGDTDARIQHSRDLLAVARSRATRHEITRMQRGVFGVGAMKREDRLRLAAKYYMHIGDVVKYCDLMIILGEWERALAVAPSVSLSYWRGLAKRYAEHLSESESNDAVPFLLATRQVKEVVDFYENRSEFEWAMLVSQAASQGELNGLQGGASGSDGASGASRDRAASGSGSGAGAGAGAGGGGGRGSPSGGRSEGGGSATELGRREVLRLSEAIASDHQRRSNTVLAACAYLAISNPQAAAHVLVKGGEIELAFALETALRMERTDSTLDFYARHCEHLGLYAHAAQTLRLSRDPGDRVALMAARAVGDSEGKADDLFEKLELPPRDTFADTVKGLLRKKNTIEALRNQVVGGMAGDAAKLALSTWNDIFSARTWDMAKAIGVAEAVGSLPLHTFDEPMRAHVLAYMCLVGGMRATWMGYTSIVLPLFERVWLSVEKHSLAFPVPLHQLLLLCCTHLVHQGWCQEAIRVLAPHVPAELVRALEYTPDDLPASDGAPFLKETATLLVHAKRELSSMDADDMSGRRLDSEVVATSSMLPRASARPIVSALSSARVKGPTVTLDDGESVCGASEALMWASVNPFSPLGTGRLLNPF